MRYMLFYALYSDRDWDLMSIEEQMPKIDYPAIPTAINWYMSFVRL